MHKENSDAQNVDLQNFNAQCFFHKFFHQNYTLTVLDKCNMTGKNYPISDKVKSTIAPMLEGYPRKTQGIDQGRSLLSMLRYG